MSSIYRRKYGANIYYNSGNVGIGIVSPSQILHVRHASNSLVRIETNTDAVSQISGIEFGIPAFTSSTRSKITSTTGGSDSSDLAFHTSSGTGGSAQRMVITSTGNVGIGTNNPTQILQVGSSYNNGGRLRIANSTADYTLIGTSDVDDGLTNTRIVIFGNTYSGYSGNIQYITTSTGSHIFYGSGSERMRITSTGNVGIGTATVSYPLHVQGNVFTSGNIMFSDTSSSAIAWGANEALGRASGAGFYSDSAAAGDLVLRSATSKRLLLQSGPNAAHMVITSTGNVGIGTTTLTSGVILDVNGNLLVRASKTGAGGTQGVFFRDGSYSSSYLYNCSILTIDHSGDNFCDGLSINAYDGVSFCTGSDSRQERMRITSTGNVGIGTATIQSSYKLQVQGNSRVENQLVFSDLYRGGGGADYACNKIIFFGAGNTPTTNSSAGFGLSGDALEYFCYTAHAFYTGTTGGTGYGTERMRITNTGKIVIPMYGAYYEGANIRWLLWGANENYYFGGDNNGATAAFIWRNGASTDGFVMYSNGNYSARGSYIAWSDIRIKKDIEDINDDTALQMILSIEPKTYKYIDGNKSKERVYGFIAQQIKEVVPEAITIIETVIPNVYKNCICEDNKRIYIGLPIDTLGCYIEISGYGKYKITKIEPDYIEFVNDMHSKDIPDGEQFVYGYEVKDFHTINKDYIFTLNVCATQELHRRIEAQSVLLKSQDDRIKDLETKVAMLMSSM